MNQHHYYLLGRAVGAFDPDGRQLTPGCLANLVNLPGRAAVILRHVWKKMLAHPRAAELLGQIDFDAFRPSILDSGSFWIGFYHERAGRQD